MMAVLNASLRTESKELLAVVTRLVTACRNRRERHLVYRGAVPEGRLMAELMPIL